MTVRRRGALLVGAAALLVTALVMIWLVAGGEIPWYAAVLVLLSEALLAGLAYAVVLLRRLHSRVARVHSFLGRHERRESRARHAAQQHRGAVKQVDESVTRVGDRVEGLVAAASQDRAETVMAIEEMGAALTSLSASLSRQLESLSSDSSATRNEASAQVTALTTELQQVRSAVDGLKAPVQRLVRPEETLRRNQAEFAQIEALIDLRSLLRPRRPMPPSRGWAAAPTSLLEYIGHVLERKPDMVVECGSGVSSIWVGYALESIGSGRCVALEHDPHYAELTREEVDRHGLSAWVDVRTAPLKRVTVGDEEYDWYDPSSFADLHDIDVVFVDGPPGATGPVARYPAMPMLRDRCTADAVFILDDADRPEEKEILEMWTANGATVERRSRAEKGWASVNLVSR